MKVSALVSVVTAALVGRAVAQSVPTPKTFGFTLTTLQGQAVRADSLWSNKPVVIMIGSYSCPAFRHNVKGFEQLMETFTNRIGFAVLYVQEAHPGSGPSPYIQGESATKENERDSILLPQPKTSQERIKTANICADALKITAPIFVDDMDNSGWSAFGGAPNSGFLMDRRRGVVEQEKWFNPTKMGEAIKKLLDSN